MPYLIDHDNAVVCNYPFNYSEIIIPVTYIKNILKMQYLFQNGYCLLYFPSYPVS